MNGVVIVIVIVIAIAIEVVKTEVDVDVNGKVWTGGVDDGRVEGGDGER